MRKRNRPFNMEDVEFVHKNYANMTATQIAEERGLSRYQVAKIVSELRKAGVDLPRKAGKRANPIEQYLNKIGVEPKPAKKGRK